MDFASFSLKKTRVSVRKRNWNLFLGILGMLPLHKLVIYEKNLLLGKVDNLLAYGNYIFLPNS